MVGLGRNSSAGAGASRAGVSRKSVLFGVRCAGGSRFAFRLRLRFGQQLAGHEVLKVRAVELFALDQQACEAVELVAVLGEDRLRAVVGA